MSRSRSHKTEDKICFSETTPQLQDLCKFNFPPETRCNIFDPPCMENRKLLINKRGSRHAAHAAKAVRRRVDQLLKFLIKKITPSSS